jgi:hypothetical protein
MPKMAVIRTATIGWGSQITHQDAGGGQMRAGIRTVHAALMRMAAIFELSGGRATTR